VIDDGASEAGQSQIRRHGSAGITLLVAQGVHLHDGVRFGQSVNLVLGFGHSIAERFRRKGGRRAEENLLGVSAEIGVLAASRDSIDLDTQGRGFEGLHQSARCLNEQTRFTLTPVLAEEAIVLVPARLAFNLGALLEGHVDGSEIDETYAYHHVALFAVGGLLLRAQTDGINEDFQHVQLLPGRLGLLPLLQGHFGCVAKTCRFTQVLLLIRQIWKATCF